MWMKLVSIVQNLYWWEQLFFLLLIVWTVVNIIDVPFVLSRTSSTLRSRWSRFWSWVASTHV